MAYENSKILNGIIISHAAKKTAVIKVERYFKHLKYKKYIKRSKKYKAHDENDEYAVGDKVSIRESKPLARHKKWVIVSKI